MPGLVRARHSLGNKRQNPLQTFLETSSALRTLIGGTRRTL